MEYDLFGAQRNVWKLLKTRNKAVNKYAQINNANSFTNLKK